jgi:hypothetical protein
LWQIPKAKICNCYEQRFLAPFRKSYTNVLGHKSNIGVLITVLT